MFHVEHCSELLHRFAELNSRTLHKILRNLALSNDRMLQRSDLLPATASRVCQPLGKLEPPLARQRLTSNKPLEFANFPTIATGRLATNCPLPTPIRFISLRHTHTPFFRRSAEARVHWPNTSLDPQHFATSSPPSRQHPRVHVANRHFSSPTKSRNNHGIRNVSAAFATMELPAGCQLFSEGLANRLPIRKTRGALGNAPTT
jgi:hypothetical protein